MQPQANNNYSINLNYPGISNPKIASAGVGFLIGCYKGEPIKWCIAGLAVGHLCKDWLTKPHLVNSGGIEIHDRSITLHLPRELDIPHD